MKKDKKIFTVFSKLSAVCMILALLWLTISASFVFEAKQRLAEQSKTEKASIPVSSNDEESANPFGTNTEEKAPAGASVSEEYLHDHHEAELLFLIASQFHINRNTGTYIAFHGELLVPPPNAA
ncbi:MAG TPA: hypothetical protein VGO58_14625 [Chitinophagaceae bacterium]|nr:hypothetical protein [Chitinophagaceae bacterium]